jgi:hypothetical protein
MNMDKDSACPAEVGAMKAEKRHAPPDARVWTTLHYFQSGLIQLHPEPA